MRRLNATSARHFASSYSSYMCALLICRLKLACGSMVNGDIALSQEY
jgi:hypothetical protein